MWVDFQQEQDSLQNIQTVSLVIPALIQWIPGTLSPRSKAVGASLIPFYADTMKCAVYLFHICLHDMYSNTSTLLYFSLLYFTVAPRECGRLGYGVRILFENPQLGKKPYDGLTVVRNVARRTSLLRLYSSAM